MREILKDMKSDLRRREALRRESDVNARREIAKHESAKARDWEAYKERHIVGSELTSRLREHDAAIEKAKAALQEAELGSRVVEAEADVQRVAAALTNFLRVFNNPTKRTELARKLIKRVDVPGKRPRYTFTGPADRVCLNVRSPRRTARWPTERPAERDDPIEPSRPRPPAGVFASV